jgi:acetyl-CoA carboxylase biotin carboxylase subunit
VFDTVLVANRGEIARRILRACRKLGLRVVMVHSEADREAGYLKEADAALCIGPAPAGSSYLNQDAILLAARALGAQAIHPGYGFLSENAGFVEKVEAAGLTFIGPASATIRMMGDKIAAKQAMRAAGVPCVPGPDEALPDDQAAVAAMAGALGYPVIVKASGGGGGRGMRLIREASQLAEAVSVTREEARRAFGNPELYVEKFLVHPRHVEIQVLCDHHGTALWLGDRDCSMQRRHQKVVEEAPAPGIPREAIAELGEACAEACRRIGYRGVGTFEFLYEDGIFAFIEMNTRLQVEHPVTEMVTGIDIVEQQLRAARGEQLALRQADITVRGHSIECRINAEDPATGTPSPGRITRWQAPAGDGVRVDTYVEEGAFVPPFYDSLIAKVITHRATREEAIGAMLEALDGLDVDGVVVNADLHRRILRAEGFAAGGADIHTVEKLLAG